MHTLRDLGCSTEWPMERGVGSIWCLVLIPGLLPGCLSQVTVVIDSYTHNSTLTSGNSVSLGTQIILVCRVVDQIYGKAINYTWTCPNGPCEVEGYYGRKVYNEHILAVNTTSTSDGGTYTCQVTATGGQEATGNFRLTVTGGDVVHSYGRLIPHEFPITDLQQISGPDGIGRITCTVSNGTARFGVNGRQTGGVTETRNGATATLVVNSSNVDSFQNRGLYCTNINTNFFYLFISSANPLCIPSLVVDRATKSAVKYQVKRHDDTTNPLIAGYEVIRFGVPMIGEYVNAGRGRRVTISPAVPGAQYRITAWALIGDGRRSARPAVEYATARETITRVTEVATEGNAAPSSDPAIISLVAVVLLLITCVALLALALAVTATKLYMLKKMIGHSDPLHYYTQTGGGEGETTEGIYDEVGEGSDPVEGQQRHYQELKLETMEKRQYESLNKDTTANV